MSLSLEQMRDLLREGAGNLTVTELSDEKADEALNLSLWELEDRFDFSTKETRYQFTTVVGQSTYSLASLNTPNALRGVALLDEDASGNQTRKYISRMTLAWRNDNARYGTEFQAEPKRYLREGDCLIFDVDPDDTYKIEVALQEGVASIKSGTKEETGLPRNWDELVVMGAIWRRHYYSEDYNRAQQASNFQVGGIRQAVLNQSKEEEDSRFAGLEVQWENPYND